MSSLTAKLSFTAGRKIWFIPFEIQVDSLVHVNALSIQLRLTSESTSFFNLKNFTLNLDNLKIALYGWWKCLVGFLLEEIYDDGSLKSGLQSNIQSTFQNTLDQILSHKQFPFYEPMASLPIRANFSLEKKPFVTPDDICLLINGTFFSAVNNTSLQYLNDTLPIKEPNST